jgi:hypothetical protein
MEESTENYQNKIIIADIYNEISRKINLLIIVIIFFLINSFYNLYTHYMLIKFPIGLELNSDSRKEYFDYLSNNADMALFINILNIILVVMILWILSNISRLYKDLSRYQLY